MKHLFLLLILIVVVKVSLAQNASQTDTLNLGFENNTDAKTFPEHWIKMPRKSDFTFKLDSTVKHSGRYALLIEKLESDDQIFGCAARPLNNVNGKEIEVRAYIKLEDVSGVMGLMLRLDGNDKILAFDNMERKGIRGTINWRQYSVKLLIPKGTKTVYVGGILSGTGKLWIDDFKILVDGKELQ